MRWRSSYAIIIGLLLALSIFLWVELTSRHGLSRPLPSCPVGEVVNASGYVYGPCQYDGPFELGQLTCNAGIRVLYVEKPPRCVASDGRYAVFLVMIGYEEYPPPPGPRPAVMPLVHLAVFVDLTSGDAVALPLAGTKALEELHRYIAFGEGGVYVIGIPDGGVSGVLKNGTLVISKTFYTVNVTLDPTRIKTSQPLEAVSGSMVRVPIK